MREMGIMVNNVHSRYVKGSRGTLGTQSLVFEDEKTVRLKCKSTLMAFNTMNPTMKDVDNLKKYQIAFENWEPKNYYDDINDSDHYNSEPETKEKNTKATLFSSIQDPFIVNM